MSFRRRINIANESLALEVEALSLGYVVREDGDLVKEYFEAGIYNDELEYLEMKFKIKYGVE